MEEFSDTPAARAVLKTSLVELVQSGVGPDVKVVDVIITGFTDGNRQLYENARVKRKTARRLASVVVKYDVILEEKCKELFCVEESSNSQILYSDLTSHIEEEVQNGGFISALRENAEQCEEARCDEIKTLDPAREC